MSSFRTSILLGIAIAIIFVIPGKPTFVHAQSDSIVEKEGCGQPKNVRDPIMDEAEREQFNVKRVEIAGSTYTRDRDFRKRMVYTNEGDIFARKNLEATIKRISKMRTIYPINMDNVEVRLDRSYKDIDIVFCVKQRPKR